MKSDRIRGLLCGLVAAVVWGGFPVITRFGVVRTSLDMYDITFIRFTIATLVTLPALFRSDRPSLKLTALLTVGLGAPYLLVVGYGLTRAPAALFAVLTPTTMVMFSAFLGTMLLKVFIVFWKSDLLSYLVVGSGVAATEFMAQGDGIASAVGWFITGGFLWAIYTVAVKQSNISAFTATGFVSAASFLIYCPLYLYFRGFELVSHPWQAIVGQVIYQGILMSVVALYFYSRAISLLGAAIGASFAALAPVISTIEAVFLLDEIPSALSAGGLAVSVLGVAAVLMTPGRTRAP
ncbi:DMT family transporter [uncultured Bradyrhizobium sp.]|uniref:DMT family transporter n=1 Tax=uncultured Bradyrhizobium sp. TaxID=199684 RepID=UPI0035C9C708